MDAEAQRTILVVDDTEAVRSLMVSILAGAGYATREAENGQEAIRIVEADAAAIDLVVLDLHLDEGPSGPSTHHRLSEIRRDLRFVLVSGDVRDPALGDLPAVPVLEKPFTPDAFLATVKEALG